MVLTSANVNTSNELYVSDVCRSVNYIESLAKFIKLLWGSFTLHETQCSLHFDKPQKNEINSLRKLKVLTIETAPQFVVLC